MSLHGHDIAYLTAGSGPVVLLIHGMAGSSSMWRHVVPGLARDYRVIAPDLLGHGDSDKPRADYSLGAYASGLRDLIAALGVESATVVGQSFGGGVAMQMAYQYPERCRRIGLVGSGGLGVEVHPILRALSVPGAEWVLPLGCTPLFRDAGAALVNGLARLGLHPGPVATQIGRSYASLADAATRRAFLFTLRSVVDHLGQRVSAHDKLYLTEVIPTLIVWGTDDRMIPVQHALDAHAAMRGSHIHLFEGAGHFPQCEDPERFVNALHDFIRTTQPAEVSSGQFQHLITRRGAA